MAASPGLRLHINVMQLTGIVMMLLFLHLYFSPWRRFSQRSRPARSRTQPIQLNQIRRIVAINLVLGLLTVAVGASGRFWP